MLHVGVLYIPYPAANYICLNSLSVYKPGTRETIGRGKNVGSIVIPTPEFFFINFCLLLCSLGLRYRIMSLPDAPSCFRGEKDVDGLLVCHKIIFFHLKRQHALCCVFFLLF